MDLGWNLKSTGGCLLVTIPGIPPDIHPAPSVNRFSGLSESSARMKGDDVLLHGGWRPVSPLVSPWSRRVGWLVVAGK